MPFNPQSIINSRLGVGLGLAVGRSLPPAAGHRLANFLGSWIARRRTWNLVRAARANQWVVSGEQLSAAELDRAVRQTFQMTARSIYNLNHYLDRPEDVRRMVQYNEDVRQLIQASQEQSRGVVLVGVHLGNFDFALRAVTLHGLKALVLTLPELQGGYQWQYRMRQELGMEIYPVSVATLREAVERLEAGGTVLTGLDRPTPGSKYQMRFFGRLACLPPHYLYLALKARVPVIVVATMIQEDGTYHFVVSEPIEMQPDPDRHQEIIQNGERVLRVAEGFIRQAPRQWAMFYSVWPETLHQAP
jgi:KDO2-lipid IV(A) lauroyltransferase